MGSLILIPLRAFRVVRDRLGFAPSFERWLKARTASDVTTGETVTALRADYAAYMRRCGARAAGDFRSRFQDLGHPVITDVSGRVIVGRIRLKHRQPRGRRAAGGAIPANAPMLMAGFAAPVARR